MRFEFDMVVDYPRPDDWRLWSEQDQRRLKFAVDRFLAELGYPAKIVLDGSCCHQRVDRKNAPWQLSYWGTVTAA